MGRTMVKHTDGFVAKLIREVLGDLPESEWIERYKLHEACGRYAKRVHGKRNSPQYRLVEDSLTVLLKHGMIERRYVPFHLKPDDPTYGKTYYRKRGADGG